MRIGLLGKSCAPAAPASKALPVATAHCRRVMLVFIVSSCLTMALKMQSKKLRHRGNWHLPAPPTAGA
jgi:hypothetical protein